MALVPALPVPSPKEHWEGKSNVVRFNKSEGDFEKEQQVVNRIRELGLLEHKIYVERQLMTRLERLMAKKDAMYGILDTNRRKRPLKDRLNATISEIRKLIYPCVVRDDAGRKVNYNVDILMGYFTHNIRYVVDTNSHCVVLSGETPETEEKLSKEVTLEFPCDVDLTRVNAQYSAGVFRVSVPFGKSPAIASDDHSVIGSTETDSTSSDCTSMTSAEEDVVSLLSDNAPESWV